MHLEKLDLNLLVAIDALLRRRNVTAAADDLHITQSAMSNALRRARKHFEDELFHYDGQSMIPTSFGEQLEQRIPDIIAQLRAVSRMRSTTDLASLRRNFSIIASDYVSTVFLSELSKHLSRAAPGISISVMPHTVDAMRAFRRGALDFMIAPKFGAVAGNGCAPLFSDGFKCVLWDQNPILNEAFTAERFFRSPMVLTDFFLEDGKSHLERWLYTQATDIQVVATVPSFIVLPHFISGTPNIATIHEHLIPHFKGYSSLTFVDPPVHVPPVEEFLITTDKHKHDTDAQLFAEAIQEMAATFDRYPSAWHSP